MCLRLVLPIPFFCNLAKSQLHTEVFREKIFNLLASHLAWLECVELRQAWRASWHLFVLLTLSKRRQPAHKDLHTVTSPNFAFYSGKHVGGIQQSSNRWVNKGTNQRTHESLLGTHENPLHGCRDAPRLRFWVMWATTSPNPGPSMVLCTQLSPPGWLMWGKGSALRQPLFGKVSA